MCFKLRLIPILSLFLIFGISGISQEENGSLMMQEPIFQPCELPINWNDEIRIAFWISKAEGQEPTIAAAQCELMCNVLTDYFTNANVTFLPFTIQTMNNWQFHNLNSGLEEMQMTIMYHHVGVINVHLVDQISNGQNIEGYAFVPPEPRDVIIMDQYDFTEDNKRLPHLIGHFFGLFDTFDTSEGIELADGTNCDVAGDLVCDTYADVAGGGITSPTDCNYDGLPLTDSEGNLYYPPVDNIMSEYPDQCRCRFTIGQFDRMFSYRYEFRTQLW